MKISIFQKDPSFHDVSNSVMDLKNSISDHVSCQTMQIWPIHNCYQIYWGKWDWGSRWSRSLSHPSSPWQVTTLGWGLRVLYRTGVTTQPLPQVSAIWVFATTVCQLCLTDLVPKFTVVLLYPNNGCLQFIGCISKCVKFINIFANTWSVITTCNLILF